MAKHTKVDVTVIKAGKNGKTGKLYCRRLKDYYEEYFNNPLEQTIVSTLELPNATVLTRLTRVGPVAQPTDDSNPNVAASPGGAPATLTKIATSLWVTNLLGAMNSGVADDVVRKNIQQQPLDRCEMAIVVVANSNEEHQKTHTDGSKCDALRTAEKLLGMLKERVGSVS